MLRLVGIILLSSFAFAKITIDKIETCGHSSDYDVLFTHKIKEKDGIQILEEGALNTKNDLDDNTLGQVDLFAFEEGKWHFIMTFQENFCQFITKYLSGVADALEKAAGLTKSCPYPAGEYKVANFSLDFEKLDYSLVPRGKLKIKATLSNVKTEKVTSCENIELTVAD